VTIDGENRWTVNSEDVGQRLDIWLTAQLTGQSRAQVAHAIRDGRVQVNGQCPSKLGLKLRLGDAVSYQPDEPVPMELAAQQLPLKIVYEDAHLAVVSKAAGMVVHPAAGHRDGTMVNALLYHFDRLSGVGQDALRPGIVHRLDRDTSGLLVVAKDDNVHRQLGEAFKAHQVERLYVAVVSGPKLDDKGSIETLFGRDPKARKKMTGRVNEGKRACTHWSVLARSEAFAFLTLRLETGRTHQIRVHLSESGHPVVGDTLYGRRLPVGGGGTLAQELASGRRMPRQALHAALLAFTHPVTGDYLRLIEPLPEDLLALVEALFGPYPLDEILANLP
jgi:23S rRNA pseudouridine1911/1915/1917 synthase